VVPLVALLATGLTARLPERWRPSAEWLLCWGALVLHAVALLRVLLPRYYL
jgi:hypothetical protein